MDDRITRIQTKLATLPATEQATLGPALTEQQLSAFEDPHGIRLPEEFRRFCTSIGHGGYGPTYGLLPIDRWRGRPTAGGAGLADPFPFPPDVDLPAPSAAQRFPGAIAVVYRGCSDHTLLVVTGPGRGRLVEVNADGNFAPHFHADADFLAWYERWLDFVLAGYRDLTWFADQMAGDEAELVTTLRGDPLVTRRRAAAYTFITYPTPSAGLPGVLAEALVSEPQPSVRETIVRALAAQGDHGRDLLPAALADPVPRVRSLAAILMTTDSMSGRRIGKHLHRVLGEHLAVEEDPEVRATIGRMLRASS
ncbi:hypothetical protein ABZS66_29610 [Dactylosporangium sp. NPDC005572]|uniref:hypothetical protein n=1 Tax=Dactylosporangium sp. NPDC005572 TaxID=3156889 RepID=UPI0033AF3545